MLKIIRYALAAICLAASVGCLALWGWTRLDPHRRLVVQHVRPPPTTTYFLLECIAGQAALNVMHDDFVGPTWRFQLAAINDEGLAHFHRNLRGGGIFYAEELHKGRMHYGCPLWFPALAFALAAVTAISLSRQFTLRSALVGMSVVAALLGIAVAL